MQSRAKNVITTRCSSERSYVKLSVCLSATLV